MASAPPPSNFKHLRAHDEQLLRLGQLAERYFPEDPNTCLLKLRQLAELLAQLVASSVGLFTSPDKNRPTCCVACRTRASSRARSATSSTRFGAPATTPTTAGPAITVPPCWRFASLGSLACGSKLLGLDLPGLVSARQRTMRLVQDLVDQVAKALVAADSGAEAAAFMANQMAIGGQLNLLQRMTEPSQPYAAAARAQLRFLGYAELCAPVEQLGAAA